MVKKRNCQHCDSTGIVFVDSKYSVICPDCKGNGFQEVTEKNPPHYAEETVLNLLHIVSKHTTIQQYERIVSQFNEEKKGLAEK